MRRGLVVLALSSIFIVIIAVELTYIILSERKSLKERAVLVSGEKLYLPLPSSISRMTVEESILNRKSIRDWRDEPVGIQHLSLILWCTYGVTERIGDWYRRSVPSAGATYPLEIYVVIGERAVHINESSYVEAGVYRYDPFSHSLESVKKGEYRSMLYEAALRQAWVGEAPLSIVIVAVYERTTGRYGERGVRYVHMEAGHAGQNIYLCSTALGLGSVAIGAFHDHMVAEVIGAKPGEQPIYIFPVGVPAKQYRGRFEDVHKTIVENRR